MKIRILALLAAAAFAVGLFPACERIDRNMWDNPAAKPQREPVRLPPKDSIPTKGKEHVPSLAEGRKMINPVPRTEGEALKGKELFGVFCVPCHGATGAGDGPVGKIYVPTPDDLRPGGETAGRSDGELFAIVSGGSGGMPAFRSDLSVVERWRIVSYLRTLK